MKRAEYVEKFLRIHKL